MRVLTGWSFNGRFISNNISTCSALAGIRNKIGDKEVKINKLTKEQEEYLPVFRQKYLDIACDGKRIKRDNLEPAIENAYKFIGKEKPLVIILKSPQQAMMAIAFMKQFASSDMGGQLGDQLGDQIGDQLGDQLWGQLVGQLWGQLWGQLGDQLWDQLWDQLRDQLWDQLRDQLWDQLWDQLRDQLWDQLRDQLWGQLVGQLRDQLWGQLRDQLWGQLGDQLGDQIGGQLVGQLWGQLRDQLWDQLWDQLGDQLWDQLWDQLGDQLGGQLRGQLWDQRIYDGNYLWGTQDLYWIAWARFAEHIGVKLEEDTKTLLSIMEDISTQCEWWWPYKGICFVSEKPTHINWDESVLHGEEGPAVSYADGYSVYSWRGTNVPKEWIEDKESITPEIALTWENVEQRRCAAEIIGWHNVLAHPSLNTKTIDKDDDPQIGELLEVTLPDVGKERFLKVECGTGRTFALPVPPDSNTALEANAWTYGLEPQDYLPEIRT